MRLIGFGITVLYILIILAGRVVTSGSLQQAPTSTPIVTFVANGQVICYLIPATPTGNTQTPNPNPIFLTATALASISPSPSPTATKTTVNLPSPTATSTQIIPPTPSQEFAVTASPAPFTMTTTAALNLRECAGTSCKVLLVIPINRTVTVFSERQLISGVMWRRVSYNGTVGWVSEVFLQ